MSGINPIVGPGSQPGEDDGAALEYMEMPKGMRTYSAPVLPEPEETQGIEQALALLAAVKEAAVAQSVDYPARIFDITGFDARNRAFIDQVLGDGEVSIVAGATIQAQESVFAGVWRVQEFSLTGALDRDSIDVGAFPRSVIELAHRGTLDAMRSYRGAPPPSVVNALALITELDSKLVAYCPGDGAHVINLTLLPLTEEDVGFLDERLGAGSVTILSRGYGNCRVSSTGTRNAWWVRYFNSRDAIVLNTIEVIDVPNVACAAPEDLTDSAQRLAEILEIYR
ncbi:HupH hydrogenase expression protein [Hyphomicrobium denitrificans 1NES1]|uniref:HupH hydrogenase expression protein n=1 Tax=Hyphomicrobium denitrificans 1NES1 TaxID=670307 RepID=N0B552_9HYPH|nr:hydrogenase expression/formation protein [Hyphomicrobium denitrificans]AGK57342.1 HupH hydrogenase expression protein [Hyphomicrobium denitrificans 1NES1]